MESATDESMEIAAAAATTTTTAAAPPTEKQSALERLFAKMNLLGDQIVEEAKARSETAPGNLPEFYLNLHERAYVPMKAPSSDEEWLALCYDAFDDFGQIAAEDLRFFVQVCKLKLTREDGKPDYARIFRWLQEEQEKFLSPSRVHVIHSAALLWNAKEKRVDPAIRHTVALGCGGDHAFVTVRLNTDSDSSPACHLGYYYLLPDAPRSSSYRFLDPESPNLTSDMKEKIQEAFAKDVTLQRCNPVVQLVANAPDVPSKPVVWAVAPDGSGVALVGRESPHIVDLYHLERYGKIGTDAISEHAMSKVACVRHTRIEIEGAAQGHFQPSLMALSKDSRFLVLAVNQAYAKVPEDASGRVERAPPHVCVMAIGAKPTRERGPWCRWVPPAFAFVESKIYWGTDEEVPHISCLEFHEDLPDVLYVGTQIGELHAVKLSLHREAPEDAPAVRFSPEGCTRTGECTHERLRLLKCSLRAPGELWWTQGIEAPLSVSMRLVGPNLLTHQMEPRGLIATTNSVHLSLGTAASAEDVAYQRRRSMGKQPFQVHERTSAHHCVRACGNLLAGHRADGALMVGDTITGKPHLSYPELLMPEMLPSIPYRSLRVYCDRVCCLLADGTLVFVLPNDPEHQRQYDEAKRKLQEEQIQKQREREELIRKQREEAAAAASTTTTRRSARSSHVLAEDEEGVEEETGPM